METQTAPLQWVALAAIALSLAACTVVAGLQPVDGFAHKAIRWDIELYWNCVRPEPGLLHVEGVAISTYFQAPIQDLTFRLDGVDAQGASVSRVEGAGRDYLIPLMGQTPYRLILQTVGTEVRFDLTYSFLGQESGGMSNSSESGYRMIKNVCPVEKR